MSTRIFIKDEYGPEDMAMVQALYSRSAKSVEEHFKIVESKGSGNFMEEYLCNYGHKSIGDCGSTTIFIENVSMLAAKAFQDNQMYSGQETSTRYIDMSKQSISDPLNTFQSRAVLSKWMEFYHTSIPILTEYLKTKYPRKEDENENIYKKAIKARAFDILRGFIPAGLNTNLSWHTNLRQAHDKLSTLKYHPDMTIRNIAISTLKSLKEKYPHSFKYKEYEEVEKYNQKIAEKYTYFKESSTRYELADTGELSDSDELPDTDKRHDASELAVSDNINTFLLCEFRDDLKSRVRGTELPRFLDDVGYITTVFKMDFGSFRDIQRHRASVNRMPLLTLNHGFEEWYLQQLPQDLQEKARSLIKDQEIEIKALGCDEITMQYYIPMGYKVACHFTYRLPALVYLVELRSQNTVHTTLRKVIHSMARWLEKNYPFIKLYVDYSQDEWDIRRGEQDIVKKNGESI